LKTCQLKSETSSLRCGNTYSSRSGTNASPRDEPITEVKRFYDVWGSLIAAAQFADFYAGRGVQVLAEEMIECPSMLAQSLLLAKRMHVSLPPSPPSPPILPI
jgi:hypothetical protein